MRAVRAHPPWNAAPRFAAKTMIVKNLWLFGPCADRIPLRRSRGCAAPAGSNGYLLAVTLSPIRAAMSPGGMVLAALSALKATGAGGASSIVSE